MQPPQPNTKSTKIRKIKNGLQGLHPHPPSNNPAGSAIVILTSFLEISLWGLIVPSLYQYMTHINIAGIG